MLQVLPKEVDELVTIPSITKRLLQSIDQDTGAVLDEASSKLHGIRQLIAKTELRFASRWKNIRMAKWPST